MTLYDMQNEQVPITHDIQINVKWFYVSATEGFRMHWPRSPLILS